MCFLLEKISLLAKSFKYVMSGPFRQYSMRKYLSVFFGFAQNCLIRLRSCPNMKLKIDHESKSSYDLHKVIVFVLFIASGLKLLDPTSSPIRNEFCHWFWGCFSKAFASAPEPPTPSGHCLSCFSLPKTNSITQSVRHFLSQYVCVRRCHR